MKSAGFRWAAPFTLAAAFAAGSCTEINGAADHVAAIEFTNLPYPSIVSGDTLRDSLGVASPLKAVFFNGNGEEIESSDVTFIALDTGLTISPSGTVTAQRRAGQVPIVASTSVLQTRAVNLLIARRPDSVAIVGNPRDTIVYLVSQTAAQNTSDNLAVRVITGDSAGSVTGTQGWLVSYQAVFRGAAIPPGDTTSVFLVSDGGIRSTLDTTSSTGNAAMKLRVRPLGITGNAADSVFVTATVRHKGQQVRGSPLRFVILLRLP